MNDPLVDWPQNALSMLAQAKRGGDVARLVLSGISNLDSWLIENRILPVLQTRKVKVLHLSVSAAGQEKRSAIIMPLPDGSAFAWSSPGLWFALESAEAKREIQHIGFRYAPSNNWQHGFEASTQQSDCTTIPMSPSETARFWEEATGTRPLGFEVGVLDQVEAFGLDVIDRFFHIQGRLGL